MSRYDTFEIVFPFPFHGVSEWGTQLPCQHKGKNWLMFVNANKTVVQQTHQTFDTCTVVLIKQTNSHLALYLELWLDSSQVGPLNIGTKRRGRPSEGWNSRRVQIRLKDPLPHCNQIWKTAGMWQMFARGLNKFKWIETTVSPSSTLASKGKVSYTQNFPFTVFFIETCNGSPTFSSFGKFPRWAQPLLWKCTNKKRSKMYKTKRNFPNSHHQYCLKNCPLISRFYGALLPPTGCSNNDNKHSEDAPLHWCQTEHASI